MAKKELSSHTMVLAFFIQFKDSMDLAFYVESS